MARVTIAQLTDEIEDLRDRIAELEAENDELREQLGAKAEITFVRSIEPPRPISSPINFAEMLWGMTADWSYYDERSPIFEERWNTFGYL